MKKRTLVYILVFLCGNIYCQLNINKIFIGYGYLQSQQIDFNNTLNSNPNINFNELNGFRKIDCGIQIELTNKPKIFFENELAFMSTPNNHVEYNAKQEFDGNLFDTNGMTDPFNLLDETKYKYGYKLNLITYGLSINYTLFSPNKFYISPGVGILACYGSLKQDGVNLDVYGIYWETKQTSEKVYDFSLGFNARSIVGFKIFENLSIEVLFDYLIGKVNLNSSSKTLKETIIDPRGDNVSFFPVSNTVINLNGLSYLLRVKYSF